MDMTLLYSNDKPELITEEFSNSEMNRNRVVIASLTSPNENQIPQINFK